MNELKLRLSKPTFDKYVLNSIFYVNYVFSKKANVVVMKIGTHYLHHKRKRLCMSKKKKKDVIFFSDVVTFLHIARVINEQRSVCKLLLPVKQDFLVLFLRNYS